MPYSETSSGSSDEEDPPTLPPRTWRTDPRAPRPITIATSAPVMAERRRGVVGVPSILVSPASSGQLGTRVRQLLGTVYVRLTGSNGLYFLVSLPFYDHEARPQGT